MEEYMAKKKVKKKFNFGAIIAAVGAILAIVAFFIPVMVGNVGDTTISGMQLTQVWFETLESSVDNLKIVTLAGLMSAADEAAYQSLQIFSFAGMILACVYLVYAVLGLFVKPCKSKILNIVLSGALLAVGIAAISSAGAIQAATTVTLLGKTSVGISMSAGAFLTAIGGGIGLVATLFYPRKKFK